LNDKGGVQLGEVIEADGLNVPPEEVDQITPVAVPEKVAFNGGVDPD